MAKSMATSLIRKVRTPYCQNFVIGILLGLTGGLYVALNLLGAGGGKPNSASTVNTANAILCSFYCVSALLGGTVLNKAGVQITGFCGVIGYILYIGSLWFFDQHGKQSFPLFAAVCVGISAGLIYVVQGSISMSYSEEKERGKFVSVALNLQAVGAVIGGIIPLIINRNRNVSAGVPTSVYVTFIAMNVVGAMMALALAPPTKVVRPDGTRIAEIRARTYREEIRGLLDALKDWRICLMIPAFLPSQTYLVYSGSVNVYKNSLRARSLLSFCSVVIQMICAVGLQYALDHPKLKRRTRALLGLGLIGVPLLAAWVWETIRVRNYDRQNPPVPVDWNDAEFAPIFILFMLNWVSSALWQYIILYFLGCFTNNPRVAANNAGVFRGFLAAGEAVAFGVDSRGTPYIIEAGIILAFYALGVLFLGYLALFEIEESKYFQEEEVNIPMHVAKDQTCDKDNVAENRLERVDAAGVPEQKRNVQHS